MRSAKWRKIRSIRELDPYFRPRFVKLVFRLLLIGVLAILVGFGGHMADIQWLLWLSLLVFAVVGSGVFLIETLPPSLVFLGYWFPLLGVWGAGLEKWLEMDLDWP